MALISASSLKSSNAVVKEVALEDAAADAASEVVADVDEGVE